MMNMNTSLSLKINAIINTLGMDADNHIMIERAQRISQKVNASPGEADFLAQVHQAEEEVSIIGRNAFNQLFAGFVEAQQPKERVYKIKPVMKGKRIEAICPVTGVRFSFGEVWCKSVREGKGIAVNPNNREKLNMHGTHMGVTNPHEMLAKELAKAITLKMDEEAANEAVETEEVTAE